MEYMSNCNESSWFLAQMNENWLKKKKKKEVRDSWKYEPKQLNFHNWGSKNIYFLC